jgi:hypothetical protein
MRLYDACMSRIELLRAKLADNVDAYLREELRAAAMLAPPLERFPVLHLATPDRRARLVRAGVYGDACGVHYPAGTPERVARELMAQLDPGQAVRSDIQRDFDFFAAVNQVFTRRNEKRRVGRPLVNELLKAWKRLAEALPPDAREGDELASWQAALGSRFEIFTEVAALYARRLADVGALDPDDIPWHVARHCEEWGLAPRLVVVEDLDGSSPARLALIRALSARAERTLVVLRGERDLLPFLGAPHEGLQEFVLDGGGAVLPEREFAPRPRAALADAWLQDVPGDAEGVRVVRAPTRGAEVREAARFAREALNAGAEHGDICIAMPRPGNYAELISEAFTAADIAFDAPFEIELHRAAPVAALLDLLRAAQAGLDRTELLDALASPYLNFGAKPLTALRNATREAWIVGGRNPQKDWLERLEGRADSEALQWLSSVLGLLEPFTRPGGDAAALARGVLALLEASGAREAAADDRTHGGPGTDVPTRALHVFEGLLHEMAREFAGLGRLAMPDFLRALTEQASARSVRPGESGGDRVRVLGLRELRGAEFTHVMVLGLTDTDLPLGEDECMFFPSVREAALAQVAGRERARHLCAPIDVARQADYLFAHMLMAGTVELVLSLPAHEGDTPFVPALALGRLLAVAGVKDDLPAPGTAPTSVHELACATARALTSAEADSSGEHATELRHEGMLAGLHGRRIELMRNDLLAPPGEYDGLVRAVAGLAERYSPEAAEDRHVFSPSQLDNYVECPQRFWSRYVMRAKHEDEPSLETPPHAVGTLIHAAFERYVHLLRQEAGQPEVLDDPVRREPVRLLDLAGGDADTARELGRRLVRRAFDEAFEADRQVTGPFWEGLKRQVCAGLPGESQPGTGLLARFIDHELEREQEGWGVRFTEFEFGRSGPRPEAPDSVPDPIDLPLETGFIRLMGSVDRVDQHADGLEIVDYKTGGARTTTEVLEGVAFQLATYLAAITSLSGEQPRGMSYLQVPIQKPVKRVDVTQTRGKPAYDVDRLVNTVLPRRLTRVMEALSEGVFVHLPFSGTGPCSYCEYRASCARRTDVVEERQRANEGLIPYVYLPDQDAVPGAEEDSDADA